MADPQAAAKRWAQAVQRGDAEAVLAEMSLEAQRAHGRDGIARLLADNREELGAQAGWINGAETRLSVEATLVQGDDRSARLVLEDGSVRVAAASALPAAARAPVDALRELRAVLERRSYEGLLRVLTRAARESLEDSLEALVRALQEPATQHLQIEGRRATARLPGGHTVKLEREDGVWRVKDFD
jgi:hypothetical protein